MHHCSVLIHILSQDEYNIFHSIPENDLKYIWKMIITLILSTDISSHPVLLARIKEIMDSGAINLESNSHRILVLSIIINAANFSNLSRPFEISEQWANMLFEETYKQGDLEMVQNFDYSSPMNDRKHCENAKVERLFYDKYGIPLFNMLIRILPECQELAEMVKKNRNKWNDIVNNPEP